MAPVDLRPLTTSELIDRGFALYRAHFAGFLLLALLCQSAPLLQPDPAHRPSNSIPTQAELHGNCPRPFSASWPLHRHRSGRRQVIVFCFEVVITFYIADAYLGKIPSVKDEPAQIRTHAFGASIWTCVLNRS